MPFVLIEGFKAVLEALDARRLDDAVAGVVASAFLLAKGPLQRARESRTTVNVGGLRLQVASCVEPVVMKVVSGRFWGLADIW